MNSSTSGASSAAAGRMMPGPAMSSGALQALGNAADAREQRREQFPILASAGAPALQQIHLHEVHGIEIRVTQTDRALHGRDEVEQLAAAADLEHLLAG